MLLLATNDGPSHHGSSPFCKHKLCLWKCFPRGVRRIRTPGRLCSDTGTRLSLENKKSSSPAPVTSRAPSATSLPSTAAAGSPSSGHLRPNRASICDLCCSTFSFLLVSPLPWCVRGDRAPAAGAVRRGRGRPTASLPCDSRAPRRRGPLSTDSPPFLPEPDPALRRLLPSSCGGGSLWLEGGRAPAAALRDRERARRVGHDSQGGEAR
jgi:hypothetical protein